MARWTITRNRTAKPSAGTDRDAAFSFDLVEKGGGSRQVIVEYAAPSTLASLAHAQALVGSFVAEDVPPQRIIVSRDGDVRTEAE